MANDPSPSPSPTARSERRERRRQERRVILSLSSLFAVAFTLSLIGALYTAWIIYPLNDVTASPAVLRADYKADYIYMISQSYAQDGDWVQAQDRLNKLNDPNLANTTLNLLEDALREGRPPEAIRNLARLAEQLGAEGDTLALFAPTPVLGGEPTVLPSPTATAEPTSEPQLADTEAVSPTIPPTATPIPPTMTPTPLPETAAETANEAEVASPQFRLLSQREICQADLSAPRIEIIIVDPNLDDLRGAEVFLEWENGRDRALTGFKPNNSAGYADFTIEPDISYTVSMSDGSATTGGLQSTPCANEDGFTGWVLRYQSLVTP